MQEDILLLTLTPNNIHKLIPNLIDWTVNEYADDFLCEVIKNELNDTGTYFRSEDAYTNAWEELEQHISIKEYGDYLAAVWN